MNAPGVYSGPVVYSRWVYEIRIMRRDCILVLFLPLHLNLYTNIQNKIPFTKVLLAKPDETNDTSAIVSISFKSW